MNGLEPKKRVTLVEPSATQQPALKKQRISPSHSDDEDDSDDDKPQVDEKLEVRSAFSSLLLPVARYTLQRARDTTSE